MLPAQALTCRNRDRCPPEQPGTDKSARHRALPRIDRTNPSVDMRAQSRTSSRCCWAQACMLRDRHACSATVSLRQRTPPRLVRRRVPVPDGWNVSDAVMRPAADAPDPSPCCAEEKALQTGEILIWLGAEEALLCVEVRSAAAKRHSLVEAALADRSQRQAACHAATPPPAAPLSSSRTLHASCMLMCACAAMKALIAPLRLRCGCCDGSAACWACRRPGAGRHQSSGREAKRSAWAQERNSRRALSLPAAFQGSGRGAARDLPDVPARSASCCRA
jgi:hypothetical protein